MGKQWSYVTEDEFEKTLAIHKAGLNNADISRFTKRPSSTISKMVRHNTLEEYRAETIRSKRQSLSNVSDNVIGDDLPSLSNNMTECLQRIASALERLADAWESQN